MRLTHLPRNLNLDEVANASLAENGTPATVTWLGQPIPVLLAPRIIDGAHVLIEFSPTALAETHKFAVAQPDAAFFEAMKPMEVGNQWPLPVEVWLENAVAQFEAGYWGRVVKFEERHTAFGMTGFEFLGALGVGGHYETSFYLDGHWGRFRHVDEDERSPECEAFRWFDGDSAQAASFLMSLDDAALRDWLKDEQQREGSALKFSFEWEEVPGKTRRTWLPVVEQDRSEELQRVMSWVLMSDPALQEMNEEEFNWGRPRFTIARDEFCGEGDAISEGDSLKRLNALWPFIWGVTKDYEEPALALRIPGVAAWVEDRYSVSVSFDKPSQHERLEALYSLRQWLEKHAPAQRTQWEPLLQA